MPPNIDPTTFKWWIDHCKELEETIAEQRRIIFNLYDQLGTAEAGLDFWYVKFQELYNVSDPEK